MSRRSQVLGGVGMVGLARHTGNAQKGRLCRPFWVFSAARLGCGRDGLDRWHRVMLSLLLNELGDEPSPASLMASAYPRAGVAVKVLVEEDVIAPVEVVLEVLLPAEHRPTAVVMAQEDPHEPM